MQQANINLLNPGMCQDIFTLNARSAAPCIGSSPEAARACFGFPCLPMLTPPALAAHVASTDSQHTFLVDVNSLLHMSDHTVLHRNLGYDAFTPLGCVH